MNWKLAVLLFVGILVLPSGIAPQILSQDIHPDDLQRLPPKQLLSVFETTKSPPLRELVVVEIIKKRNEAIPVLRESALKGTEEQRLLALKLLGEMQDEKAASIAISSLDDSNVKIQRRACTVLMKLKSTAGYQPLVRQLKESTDTGVIKSAIAALGAIGNRQGISLLRPYLKHENDSVKVNTAIALAQLGSQEGLDVVLSALTSPDLQAQREATYGLGFFSDARVRSAADAIIEDPNGSWKSEAHIAIARIRMSSLDEAARWGQLRGLLEHSDYRVRLWAIDQVAETGTQDAVATLRRIAAAKTKAAQYANMKVSALER